MRVTLRSESSRLDALFTRFAVSVAGGTSLFRYLDLPDASGLFAALGQRGILLRHYDERPNILRAGLPGSGKEWLQLEAALAEWKMEPSGPRTQEARP
jgi:cobalamin biosynthetic protein CobC